MVLRPGIAAAFAALVAELRDLEPAEVTAVVAQLAAVIMGVAGSPLTGDAAEHLEHARTPPRVRSRALWLRPAQVVEEYGIARPTVYDWIYKRRVTTKKLGKSKRAPVQLYRPDVERLATVRRPLRSPLTRGSKSITVAAGGGDQGGAEGARRESG